MARSEQLAVSEAARQAVERRDATPQPRVALVPVTVDRPLPGSPEVVVAEPVWRAPR